MGIQRRLVRIISPGIKLYVKHYFKKPRNWNYVGLKFTILPTVFFPHFTHSTKMLLRFFNKENLSGKSFLELGCGMGAVSTLAAKKGAIVTATDINPAAVENASLNAVNNGVELTAIQSNLFESIPKQEFDIIIINPPYYPKKPANDAEYAWFCGEDFDYFNRCFKTLPDYFSAESTVYMILSEDCELDQIQAIAAKNKLKFTAVHEEKKWDEMTVIYEIAND